MCIKHARADLMWTASMHGWRWLWRASQSTREREREIRRKTAGDETWRDANSCRISSSSSGGGGRIIVTQQSAAVLKPLITSLL